MVTITGRSGEYDFTADNESLIVAAAGSVSGTYGVDTGSYNGGFIQNNGTITGGMTAIAVDGSDIVVQNTGNITGAENYTHGILGAMSGTITNSGTISAGEAIGLNGRSGVTVNNSGLIKGTLVEGPNNGHTAIRTGISQFTVTNSGTIDGDLDSAGPATTIHNGGTIDGDVFLGGGRGNLSTSTEVFDGDGGHVTGVVYGYSETDLFDLSHQTVDGIIVGGLGADTIIGTAGNDTIWGDNYNGDPGVGDAGNGDNLSGGDGNDTINGGLGNDIIAGGTGNDTISGGTGDDAISGGPGIDTISGGPGVDTISGNGGADILSGNGGADVIAGGAGADTLTGGAGNDSFVYSLVTDSPVTGADLITDFTHGSDKIDLTALHLASASDVTITSSGGMTTLHIDANNDGTVDMVINLSGANVLTASDIVGVPANAPAGHVATATSTAAVVHPDILATLHAPDHALYG